MDTQGQGVIQPSSSSRASCSSSTSSMTTMQRTDSSQNLLQLVLRTRDHAAFYSPSSHSLSLQPRIQESRAVVHQPAGHQQVLRTTTDVPAPLPPRAVPHTSQDAFSRDVCPTCLRPWSLYTSTSGSHDYANGAHADPDILQDVDTWDDYQPSTTSPNYFRLLAQGASIVEDASSSYAPTRASTPGLGDDTPSSSTAPSVAPNEVDGGAGAAPRLAHDARADGYYARFFVELKKLGRGARGQVYLCQHVLNGNRLSTYAVKKIPCGDHAQSLLESLKEVHLMETLQHPNVIHYQHAWIEDAQSSPFAPVVPTLHVLMMAANGGSLADWIYARSGHKMDSPHASGTSSSTPITTPGGTHAPPMPERARAEKLKAAFRRRRAAKSGAAGGGGVADARGGGGGTGKHVHVHEDVPAVHLLREDEIVSLLSDMAAGLGFLHSRGVLHLDVKPGNALLHWDEDALIPRVLISDFGSSMLQHDNWLRTRSGYTGTMEFMAPESLRIDPRTGNLEELTSKADMWSLGMILHLLLFFKLPYSQIDDIEILRKEMLAYKGMSHELRLQPITLEADSVLLPLLRDLLQIDPTRRPSCDQVLARLAQHRAAKEQQEHASSGSAAHRRGSKLNPNYKRSQNGSKGGRSNGKNTYEEEREGWRTSSFADSHPLVRRRLSLSAPPDRRNSWLELPGKRALSRTWIRLGLGLVNHAALCVAIASVLLQQMLIQHTCGNFSHPNSTVQLALSVIGIFECVYAAHADAAAAAAALSATPATSTRFRSPQALYRRARLAQRKSVIVTLFVLLIMSVFAFALTPQAVSLSCHS